VALAVVGVLIALQLIPSLLRPPDPPPLPPDVGLPRVAATQPSREPGRPEAGTNPNLGREASGGGARRGAEAAEGSAPSHKPLHPGARGSAKRKPTAPARRQDPPANPPVPAPEPSPPPEPPPSSPAPSDDGSMEFAPH